MKHAIRTLVVVALLAGAPSTAFAQEAATVTCKDGSTSKAGKGACSHHGGVARSAPSAPTAVPAAPPRNDNATPPAAPRHPAAAPSTRAPGKPTAACKDGTTSYSAHHSGACSHHGGVKQWLDGS